jgi:hypothetical protein
MLVSESGVKKTSSTTRQCHRALAVPRASEHDGALRHLFARNCAPALSVTSAKRTPWIGAPATPLNALGTVSTASIATDEILLSCESPSRCFAEKSQIAPRFASSV